MLLDIINVMAEVISKSFSFEIASTIQYFIFRKKQGKKLFFSVFGNQLKEKNHFF